MKSILYIGNNLTDKTSNPTSIKTLGASLENEGYSVAYSSHFVNKLLRGLHMIFCVVKNSRKTDVLIIDTYSTINFYYAFIVSQLARIFKIAYIPILHGGNLAIRLKNNPKLSQMIFGNALTNVSPSEYQKATFETYGYTNLTYIPNTIDIENYAFTKRNFTSPKLLWVRSFSTIYNPLMAIRVLKTLKDAGIGASLCMVGPDSDGTLKEVEELARQLCVEVEVTGKLTKQQWINLSQAYNVFINTTNVDNMPVSVIEAMALGLPIVSTNVGGIPYLIKNGIHGQLVEKNNDEAMAKAIIEVFKEDEKRNEMVTNARKLAESFDWQLVKTQWNEILQN